MITYADDGKTLNPIEPHQREWALFFIFGLAELDADVEGWEHQVDWVRARFNSVDAWLGSKGGRHRQNYDWDNPSPEFVARWRRLKRLTLATRSLTLTSRYALFCSTRRSTIPPLS